MAIESRFQQLPLGYDASYFYTVPLGNQTYTVSFTYQERSAFWYMTVADDAGVAIYSNIRLVPNYPLTAGYVSGLPGIFYLLPNSAKDTEKYKQDPRNLAKYYTLVYMFFEDV